MEKLQHLSISYKHSKLIKSWQDFIHEPLIKKLSHLSLDISCFGGPSLLYESITKQNILFPTLKYLTVFGGFKDDALGYLKNAGLISGNTPQLEEIQVEDKGNIEKLKDFLCLENFRSLNVIKNQSMEISYQGEYKFLKNSNVKHLQLQAPDHEETRNNLKKNIERPPINFAQFAIFSRGI